MTSTTTPNYGLVKPTPNTGEFVNVQTQLNDNWDKIDSLMNKFDVVYFTATGTWNKPANCRRVEVEVVGGGGAGGGCAATGVNQASVGGGGGAGGYSRKIFDASTLASSETVTVGTGGSAAVAGNNAGGTGAGSSFATGKAYVLAANGGVGGAGMAATAGPLSSAGGTGGAGAGDLAISGGAGGPGVVIATAQAIPANFGAASRLSPNVMPPVNTNTIGTAGALYGGGSTGALLGPSSAATGSTAGGNGIVIVRQYY